MNKTPSLACKEIFMMFPVVIIFSKQFYLTEAINEKLLNIQAAGLIDYWQSEIIDQRLLKRQESSEPKGIKFEYLSGSFYILGISCVFSLLVFLGELFHGRCLRKSRNRHTLYQN